MIVLVASMLIAAGAWLRVEGVIPFSMQSFAVLLIAGVLGGKRAFAAVVAYLIEGAAGLPVFAGGPAGLIHFSGSTTGYLVGFAIAAYVIGSTIERRKPQSGITLSIVFFIGHIIILGAGLLWLVPFVGIQGAFAAGVAPFLLTAVLKSVLAAMAVPPAMRIIGRIA
ncbi:MAG: biotin transporter BioY [Planctomycetes bacterium]|nr:biotin transporter BioY [Planctomycetota bacterium]